MISILLTTLTENFQQPLMAPAINSSVITKLSMSLTVNNNINHTAVNSLLQY